MQAPQAGAEDALAQADAELAARLQVIQHHHYITAVLFYMARVASGMRGVAFSCSHVVC